MVFYDFLDSISHGKIFKHDRSFRLVGLSPSRKSDLGRTVSDSHLFNPFLHFVRPKEITFDEYRILVGPKFEMLNNYIKKRWFWTSNPK